MKARWWACALAVAHAAPALAQDAAPRALRWTDVAAALDGDPRLAAARGRIRAAEGGLAAARTPPNPELEAAAGRGRAQDGTARRGEWELAISIPLGWLARRGPGTAAAAAGVEAAAAEAEALRADVAAELWRLFVTAGYAEAEVAALEDGEAQADALVGLVRRRVDAGEGRPVEVPRVEVELERTRGEVAAARAARGAALAQLSAWLAAPVGRVELPAEPPGAVTGADARRHPRVRAALARAEAARAEASAARRSRIPSAAVGAYWASELDREAVGARITIELPVWDWKIGEIRRADAAADAEAARADAEARGLAAALAEADAACERARDAAERERERILPRAEASARTLERTFQLGEAGLLDVIDARRVLADARRAALQRARERDLACGAVILLSGRELPCAR